MPRQSEAFYDDGTQLSPLDSEKHIFAQIAANTGRLAGSNGDANGPVVGVRELDTWAEKSADYTVAAGALSWAFKPLSGFTGTVNGVAWTEALGALSRAAQPGNTLSDFAIVRTAGSYLIAEARPS